MAEATLATRLLQLLRQAGYPAGSLLHSEIEGLSFSFSQFQSAWTSYVHFDRHRNFIVRFNSRRDIAKHSKDLNDRLDRIAMIGPPEAARLIRSEFNRELAEFDSFVKLVQTSF